jgi:hypothetical protein
MLVSSWDEGGGSPWQALLYGRQGVAGWPRKVVTQPAHVAIAPPLCTKVVVVDLKTMLVEKKEGKEEVGGRPASHFGQSAKPWPPLSPIFLHPPHLVSLVLKSPTKSIKRKAISRHSFSKFLSFIYFFEIFDFMTCNDGKQKHVVENE